MNFLLLLLAFFFLGNLYGQEHNNIIVGAERVEEYYPMLLGKKVGVFANHSSIIQRTNNTYIHTIDTLIKLGINIVKIFSPEHGFSGNISNGEYILKEKEYNSNIPVIPTYSSQSHQPDDSLFNDIDIIVFDIQDVGIRFYTYISSLEYMLKASFENFVDFIILDRPNPNIDHVDGPILDKKYKSFVGMQPIPVIYGMTIAEYATMILGENWVGINMEKMKQNARSKNKFAELEDSVYTPTLHLIACKNYYRQDSVYTLPVPPSPNLRNMHAIHLYPSLCFFEGTNISVGRGTKYPFEFYGSTEFSDTLFSFYVNTNNDSIAYYGYDLRNYDLTLYSKNPINLQWLLNAYALYPNKEEFFSNKKFFDLLAGSSLLRQQIEEGQSASEIRNSWQKNINHFMTIREKYLVYQDKNLNEK